MKLVNFGPRPNMKTYWCTRCDRFVDAPATAAAPNCPVHGTPMVDRPDDPRRFEAIAPLDRPERRPQYQRGLEAADVEALLQRTSVLDGVTSSRPIPLIANTEDEDIKMEAANGLLLRGQQVSVSIPPPRYQWGGRLDPQWAEKFLPVLQNCDVVIYARRPGAVPNPATQLELETLRQANKRIIIYERA